MAIVLDLPQRGEVEGGSRPARDEGYTVRAVPPPQPPPAGGGIGDRLFSNAHSISYYR